MNLKVCVSGKKVDMDFARRIALKFQTEVTSEIPDDKYAKYFLIDKSGVSFISGKQELKGDFLKMLPRVTGGHLAHEILFKAAKPLKEKDNLKGVDCTAGLGEDSFLLAAYGYEMELFEHNPITAVLLNDALIRARQDARLKDIAKRMTLTEGDSKELLKKLNYKPDLIYLDPMFPEKKKSAETKKKLQVLHQIEAVCSDEEELLAAAKLANPDKIVIKRPPEGAYLGGLTPSFSVTRKAVRFDCLVL